MTHPLTTLRGLALPLLAISACGAQTLHTRSDPAPSRAPESAQTASVAAQLSVEGYEHLLNLLFPADHAIKPGLDYTLVLRFEPHLHPESQVVIHRYHSGKVEASFDRVLEGNAWRAAYASGDDLTNSQYETVAKTIPVRHNAFTVTDADVQAWHAQLFPLLAQGFSRVRSESRQIQRSGTWKAMANGTRYELWLIQGDDEVHLISWDDEVEPTPNGSTGLIRWMNTVRWHAAGHTLANSAPPAQMASAEIEPHTPGTTASAASAPPTRETAAQAESPPNR